MPGGRKHAKEVFGVVVGEVSINKKTSIAKMAASTRRRASSLQEPEFSGPGHGLGPAPDFQFAVQVADVLFNRIGGYNQLLRLTNGGDFAAAAVLADELLAAEPRRAELQSLAAQAVAKAGRVKDAYDALRAAPVLEPANQAP